MNKQRFLAAWIATLAITVSMLAAPLPARAAIQCATPGNDGAGSVTGIVNTYYPGSGSPSAGATTVTLGTRNASGAATVFAAGDLALIVQIQDATVNSSNTGSYGDGSSGSGYTALNSAGKYEYVKVTAVAGATLTIGGGTGGGLLNSYHAAVADGTTVGQSTWQVIRVPQYATLTLTGTLTPAPWNGSSGGVIAVDVQNSFTFSNSIDASGKGFRGGGLAVSSGNPTPTNSDYRQLATYKVHGSKGEGIAGTPNYIYDGTTVTTIASPEGYPNGSMAEGAPGNAGGGGTDQDPVANDDNTGGGGGGNGGAGGVGGRAWNGSGTGNAIGGRGGSVAPSSAAVLFLGGGGGAGSNNNTSGAANASSGGVGGGLIAIRMGTSTGSMTINTNGTSPPIPANDGGGGGGAGGTLTVTTPDSIGGTITFAANGGNGSNANTGQSGVANDHGPGGGGGGGAVLYNSSLGGSSTGTVNPGNSGITSDGTAYGSSNGSGGSAIQINTSDVVGVASGAECGATPAGTFALGPIGAPTASGQFDGSIPNNTNNDFTARSFIPAGFSAVNASTNINAPDGSGTPYTSAVSLCIGHDMTNISAGNKNFSVTAQAPDTPTGWTVQLFSDNACTVALTGSTAGYSTTGAFAAKTNNGITVQVYAKYTSPAAGVIPFTRYDGTLSAYVSNNSASTNNTHDELYSGFVATAKSGAVTTSTCTGANAGKLCPGSIVTYTIQYRNIVVGAASETSLPAATIVGATGFTIVEDGIFVSGTNTNNWGTNGVLNAAPSDVNSASVVPTYAYKKNGTVQGTFASANYFSATYGTRLSAPNGVGTTFSAGTLTFTVKIN